MDRQQASRMVKCFVAGLALALVGSLPLAGVAGAAEKVVTVNSPGPGPAEFDRVNVHQFGPKKPKRVLVLMPGTIGGAGNFTLIARDLVERVPKLAVWSVDRRSQVLEDTSAFAAVNRGEITLQQMFDYYLGWTVNGGTPADHFDFLDASTVPFGREWGMETALNDVRRVVRKAGKGNRQVFLGGHSLGASLTAAYAAWDFKGKPGFEDVEGLVLIDGGLLDTFVEGFTLEEIEAQIADLETGNPFADLLGIGVPEAAGLFGEIGGMYAKFDPLASAAPLQDFPLLPDEFDPGFPVTNRALLGHAFDRDTSPQTLRLLHVNGGGLASSGDPRDWVDGGVTPVANLAEMLGQEPGNGVEWYFPRRLTIDTDGANEMRMNPIAKFLGLRLKHTDEIDVPIYAFQTDLTGGDVLKGARALVKRAETTKRESKLVDGTPEQSHLDPMLAAPGSNEFLKTVVKFIKKTK